MGKPGGEGGHKEGKNKEGDQGMRGNGTHIHIDPPHPPQRTKGGQWSRKQFCFGGASKIRKAGWKGGIISTIMILVRVQFPKIFFYHFSELNLEQFARY